MFVTKVLSNNFEGALIRFFDKLRACAEPAEVTSGCFLFMVSLLDHGAWLWDRFNVSGHVFDRLYGEAVAVDAEPIH